MSFFDKILKTVDTVNQIKSTVNQVKNEVTPEPLIIAEDGTKIKKDDLVTNYNFKKIKLTQNNFYLIQDENIRIAKREITDMNMYLAEAPKKHPCFPYKQIKAEQLTFTESKSGGTNKHCFFSFAPLTNSGKKPKYPYTLHFYASEELFGELHYGQSGEVDKARIIAWSEGICCELHLAMINGRLDINTIYQHNPITYKKQKMYFAKKEGK